MNFCTTQKQSLEVLIQHELSRMFFRTVLDMSSEHVLIRGLSLSRAVAQLAMAKKKAAEGQPPVLSPRSPRGPTGGGRTDRKAMSLSPRARCGALSCALSLAVSPSRVPPHACMPCGAQQIADPRRIVRVD